MKRFIDPRKALHQTGFTLVEVLFAITIGVLLLGAIFVAVQSGQRSSVAIESKVATQQDARAVLAIMEMEIGMASYNATFAPASMWLNPADCAAAGVAANKGIQVATVNTLTVEMDTNENGSLAPGIPGNQNEIISYVYDIPNQRLTRSTNCGGAQEFLGCLDANGNGRCDSNESLRTTRIINNTLGIPVFQYFDATGATTANIPAIRRIDITLAVQTDEIDPNTGQRRTMIYSTSVVPKNHAIFQN
ncbi:MAG: PulJ/GspJ family protein [Nitrospirota bacterium]